MNSVQRYIETRHWGLGWIIAILLGYKIALDVFGRMVLCPIWGNEGFSDNMTARSYGAGWLFCLILGPWILQLYRNQRISSHIVLLLVLVSMIPTASYFGMVNPPLALWSQMFLFWTFFLATYVYAPYLKIRKGGRSHTGWMVAFITLTAVVVLYVWVHYAHCRIQTDLFNVYDIRFEARNYAMPTIFAYLLNAAGAILPLGVLYCLKRKKWLYALLLTVVVFCNFSIAGHKSVVFFYMLSVIGYFFMAMGIKYLYALLFLGLVVFGNFEKQENKPVSFVVHRVMYIPAKLHIDYYDFFHDKEKDYMRQGALRRLGLKSPYEENIQFIIGEELGRKEVRANNGLFSDAYSNFGLLGMLLLPLVLVFTLRILDGEMQDVDMGLWPIPIILFVSGILSVTYTSALLTNGLLWVMIFFLLYQENKDLNDFVEY